MPNKLEQPAGNASTDDWRAYALQERPADADAIAEMGRDELRDAYGTPVEADAAPDPVDETPQAQTAPGFENVMPPTVTDAPTADVFRVTLSDQRWDLDAVEFVHDGEPVRVARTQPLLLSEDEADALIQAAGERGFALTKEKVQ